MTGFSGYRWIGVVTGAWLSACLFVWGIWLMRNTSPIMGVGPMAAGVQVYLYEVADVVVPDALSVVTATMKWGSGLVLFGWAILSLTGWPSAMLV